MTNKPPYVKINRRRLRDGSVRVLRYYGPSGARLDGEPGSAEFVESYRIASSETWAEAEARKLLRRWPPRGSDETPAAPPPPTQAEK